MQIQSVRVCSRIDSTWRSNSSIGGSNAAMQIAICGAPGSGTIGLATAIRASSASTPRFARRPKTIVAPAGRGPMRAKPQNPAR